MENDDVLGLIYSLSLPSIKNLLLAIADKTDNTINIEKINDLYNISEIGSFKIDYSKDNKACVTYIILKNCDKDHNLTNEFDKLKPYLSEQQWNKVLGYLSSLVYFIRVVYENIYKNIHMGTEYEKLLLDSSNTTLYVPNIDIRIGIFLEEL